MTDTERILLKALEFAYFRLGFAHDTLGIGSDLDLRDKLADAIRFAETNKDKLEYMRLPPPSPANK